MLGSFDFWTGWGAVGLTATGGLLVVLGTLLSALGQSVQQKEITDLAKENARLARETHTSISGSPDAYLVVFPNVRHISEKDEDWLYFKTTNLSDFPLIDTRVFVSHYYAGAPGKPNSDFGEKIGDVYEHSTGPRLIGSVLLRRDVDNFTSIVIQSRSVALHEKLVVTWNGSEFETDYSLRRLSEGGSTEDVIKSIRADFPFKTMPTLLQTDEWNGRDAWERKHAAPPRRDQNHNDSSQAE